jgi:hypothetical protein
MIKGKAQPDWWRYDHQAGVQNTVNPGNVVTSWPKVLCLFAKNLNIKNYTITAVSAVTRLPRNRGSTPGKVKTYIFSHKTV